jgi:probable rRNA maturation factor
VNAVVSVQNRTRRKGVPLARSFERWVAAVPDPRRRRSRMLVTIVTVGTREGRVLNRRYRGRDYATNVLSFPYEPLPGAKAALLGDLAICVPVVLREAREQGKRPRDHFAHLTVHGVLHLLGHDHDSDREAEAMEAIETRVLAGLGIADPYAG